MSPRYVGVRPTSNAGPFEHVIEQCVLADQIGYRSVWFVEHHFTCGFSHSSAPETMLAALSRITSRIRLGHGVVLLPFEHPACRRACRRHPRRPLRRPC